MKTVDIFHRAHSVVANEEMMKTVEELNRKLKKRDTRIESLIAAQSQSTQFILELKMGILALEKSNKELSLMLEKAR